MWFRWPILVCTRESVRAHVAVFPCNRNVVHHPAAFLSGLVRPCASVVVTHKYQSSNALCSGFCPVASHAGIEPTVQPMLMTQIKRAPDFSEALVLQRKQIILRYSPVHNQSLNAFSHVRRWCARIVQGSGTFFRILPKVQDSASQSHPLSNL